MGTRPGIEVGELWMPPAEPLRLEGQDEGLQQRLDRRHLAQGIQGRARLQAREAASKGRVQLAEPLGLGLGLQGCLLVGAQRRQGGMGRRRALVLSACIALGSLRRLHSARELLGGLLRLPRLLLLSLLLE